MVDLREAIKNILPMGCDERQRDLLTDAILYRITALKDEGGLGLKIISFDKQDISSDMYKAALDVDSNMGAKELYKILFAMLDAAPRYPGAED